jgi:hypothetical protein
MHGGLDAIRTGPWRPLRGQDRVVRLGRGTAVSQAELDFDIFRVASDRKIDRVSSERVPYRANRLDGPQIDQGRDGKAVDCSVRVLMRLRTRMPMHSSRRSACRATISVSRDIAVATGDSGQSFDRLV